jgi:hypothetical protein
VGGVTQDQPISFLPGASKRGEEKGVEVLEPLKWDRRAYEQCKKVQSDGKSRAIVKQHVSIQQDIARTSMMRYNMDNSVESEEPK